MISAQRTDESSPALAVSQRLCAHLAQGLHAAAQPLTILQASLSKEHIDSMQAEELRELAADSAVEVQRVCTLFHYLQQLVVAESIQPELALTAILPLVQHVAEGIYLLFEQDGIQLRWVMPATCPPLLLDRGRTLQALSNVLLAAHAVASQNDTIEVVISSLGARALRIVVRNCDEAFPSIEIGPVDTELSLSMAVAEANIYCQRGVFSWNLRPFRVNMELRQIQGSDSERLTP